MSETKVPWVELKTLGNEKERERLVREKFLEVVTVEDMVAIFKKLIEKAQGGSVQAAKMVLGLVFGKPGSRFSLAEMEPIAEPRPSPQSEGPTGAVIGSSGELTVEDVFKEPLRPEELRAARTERDLAQSGNLNGGKGPPRR